MKVLLPTHVLILCLASAPAWAQAERWLTAGQCASVGGQWKPDKLVVGTTGAPMQLCIVPSGTAPLVRGASAPPGRAPRFKGSDISGLAGGALAAGQVLSTIAGALDSRSDSNPYQEAEARRQAQISQEKRELARESARLNDQARALAAENRDEAALALLQKAWDLSNQSGVADLAIYRNMQLIHAKIAYRLALELYRGGQYKRSSFFLVRAAHYAASAQNDALSDLVKSQNAALQQQAASLSESERGRVEDTRKHSCSSINGELLCQ